MQRGISQLVALLWLGACASTVPGSIGAVLAQSNSDRRVTVREAPVGLPAARAGIVPGDEILFINGSDVRRMSPDTIHLALEGEVGTTVHLTVVHEGAVERLDVVRGPLVRSRTAR